MSTQIKVKCIDQSLTLISTPLVASGGLNEDTVTFEFCQKWTGFSKTAVFYRNKKDVYYNLIDSDNTCYIPQEVLEEDGTLYFGVFGTNDSGVTRTSEILRYKVVEGAITKDIKPSDPTPDIYEQLLAKWQDIKDGEVKFTQDITKQQNAFEEKITTQQNTFESNITKQQNAFEEDITNKQTEITKQWTTYKTDLTNQQNTFEANITKKENDFEDTTTGKLDKYESEIEDIASSAVTKAQISVEITLTTNWVQDSTNGYYTQNVEVDGIKPTDMPTLDVKFTGDSDNMKAINKEWSKILSAETYEDGIKFYAKSATTKELIVIVKGALSKVNISEMTKEQAIKYFSGTFVNIEDIVDNLTSANTDKPLSAKQGKVLDEKISSNVSSLEKKITDVSTKENTFETNINTEMSTFKSDVDTQIAKKLSNVYRVCGSVANYEALPTSAEVGDVYNLLDNGTNYVWTGTEWDSLAGIVDLSAYLKTADASNTYATKTALSTTNTNVTNNATAITNEKSARTTADTTLTTNLNNEISNRKTADEDLLSKITAEQTAREKADTTLTTNLDSEISARKSADTTLQANIDKKANQSDLSTTNTNLSNEVSNRTKADTVLQTNIDNEEKARIDGDSALQTSITNEVSARQSADTTLQGNIDSEVSRAQNAESTLTNNLTAEVTRATKAEEQIANDLSSEITRAKGAEQQLTTDLASEVTRAKEAEETLTADLATEVSDRESAIADVLAQIGKMQVQVVEDGTKLDDTKTTGIYYVNGDWGDTTPKQENEELYGDFEGYKSALIVLYTDNLDDGYGTYPGITQITFDRKRHASMSSTYTTGNIYYRCYDYSSDKWLTWQQVAPIESISFVYTYLEMITTEIVTLYLRNVTFNNNENITFTQASREDGTLTYDVALNESITGKIVDSGTLLDNMKTSGIYRCEKWGNTLPNFDSSSPYYFVQNNNPAVLLVMTTTSSDNIINITQILTCPSGQGSSGEDSYGRVYYRYYKGANSYWTDWAVLFDNTCLAYEMYSSSGKLQQRLTSGTNIKTINGNSILGTGNLSLSTIPSGGVKNNLLYKKSDTDGDVGWTSITTDNLLTQDNIVNNLTSSSTTNALGAGQGNVLKKLVDNKQDKLVSGTTIKTINGASLLGSGDIELATKSYVDEQISTVINANY